MSARLLLDANLSPETAEYLRRLGYRVESVQELGWGNRTDEEIVEKAIRGNHVLVTFDRDFSQTWYLSKQGALSVIWLRLKEQKVDHVNLMLSGAPPAKAGGTSWCGADDTPHRKPSGFHPFIHVLKHVAFWCVGKALEKIRGKDLVGSLAVVSEKGYKIIRW